MFAARRQFVPVLRASGRRMASSTAQQTQATEQAAKQAVGHAEASAKEAVNKVQGQAHAAVSTAEQQAKQAMESAAKYYNSAADGAKRVAGPVTEKLGGMLGGYKSPLVYNFKVFTSLCRQVYVAEKLAFPTSLTTWVTAYARIWSRASNIGWWREIAKSGEWVKVGIYGLEAYGIFKIGEILGRRNLVGYKLKENHEAVAAH